MKLHCKNQYSKIIGAVILCLCCSILAHAIPASAVQDRIKSSVGSFSGRAVWPMIMNNYSGSTLDDFTDAIYLNMAGYDGKGSLLERMAANYRNRVGDPCEDLTLFVSDSQETYRGEYARYWFGSVFFIKILLLFFDYPGIQMFNQIVQLFLLFYLLYLMIRRDLAIYCVPLLASLLFLLPTVISLSLQYSPVYCLTLIAMILILKKQQKLQNENSCGGGVLQFFYMYRNHNKLA